MTLKLVTAYSGIDSFGHEVDLRKDEHSWITDKLDAYCKKNWDTLREFMDIAEACDVDDLEEGDEEVELTSDACLLVYFYFADWIDEYDLEPDMTGDKYPCFAVTPKDIGLVHDKVMELLNSLPPITVNSVD